METTKNASVLTLTEEAKKEVKRLIAQKELSEQQGLRIGVEGGGCAGMNYVLGFDAQKEKDNVYEIEGIKIFVDKTHLIYLIGMEVDFQHGLNARGFVFANPNSKSTCGCGTSFSI